MAATRAEIVLDHFVLWADFMEADLIITELLKVLLLAADELKLMILSETIKLELLAKMEDQVSPDSLMQRSIYYFIIMILLMVLILKYPAVITQILIEHFHLDTIKPITIVNLILILVLDLPTVAAAAVDAAMRKPIVIIK